ncbi:hypothetical protein Lal_00043193 [Lupinus albus]|nr:hypothetical protein Lal_00043193 [Lupinus albus]
MKLLSGWRLSGRSLVQQVVLELMVRLGHCGLKGEWTGKCFGSRRDASLVTLHSSHTPLNPIQYLLHVVMEICRLRELHTLKGHVESVVKLKGLDIDTIQQHYTV